MRQVTRHRSVQASAAAGVPLAVLGAVRPMPWLLWAAWGALTLVAATQAVRDGRRA